MTLVIRNRWAWLAGVLVFCFFHLLAPHAGASVMTDVLSSTTPVTRGAVLETHEVTIDGEVCRVYVIKADLTDEYLEVRPLFGQGGTLGAIQTVTGMARESGAVAALNGDFFQMNVGKPIGITVRDGQLVTSPALRTDMYGLGFYGGRVPQILVFGFAGKVSLPDGTSFPLAGVNKPAYLKQTGVSADMDALQLYTPLWGSRSRGKVSGLEGPWVEAVVAGDVVQNIVVDGEPLEIPRDGYILSGHGVAAAWMLEHLKPGTRVDVTYSVNPGNDLVSALGGQSLLVRDGVVPSYFDQDVPGKRARSAAGYSADNRYLYLVAVEGGNGSRGMTQREFAQYLVTLGVWRAVNLDGGGSTTLVARPPGYLEARLVNNPEGGSQRRVPTAWGLFTTAPRGNLSDMVIEGPSVVLSGTAAAYTALGLDEYLNPYPVDPAGVVWDVDSPYGAFAGNVFTAGARGEAVISAAAGQVKQTKTVRVLGAEDVQSLVVKPASIEVKAGQKVTLAAEVQTKEGLVFPVPVENIQWTATGDVGAVAGGEFVAGARAGSGYLEAACLGLKTEIPVIVSTGDTAIGIVQPGAGKTLQLEGGIEVDFPAGWTGEPRKVAAIAGTSQAGNLPQGVKLLSAVAVGALDDQPFTGLKPWRVRWQFSAYQVPAGNETSLRVLVWDAEKDCWQPVPSYVNPSTRTVTARQYNPGTVILVLDLRPAPVFNDTAGHWAAASISAQAASGVVAGFPGGSFKPGESVTRAQFVVMIRNAMVWPEARQAPVFTDMIPDWASGAVATAVNRGVVSGYPRGDFRPQNTITRAEMAVILSRLLEKEGLSGTVKTPSYKDLDQVPGWAAPAVARASGAGLVKGDPDGNFRPRDNVTRAEAVTVIDNLLRLLLSN